MMSNEQMAKMAVDAHNRASWALRAAKEAVRVAEYVVKMATEAEADALKVRDEVCELTRRPYVGPASEDPTILNALLSVSEGAR